MRYVYFVRLYDYFVVLSRFVVMLRVSVGGSIIFRLVNLFGIISF